MLWIAIHLPLLSLEAFAAASTSAAPPVDADASPPEPLLALTDSHRITAANAAAQSRGVQVGATRATALALAPQLVLGRSDPARDSAALEAVAHAALAFTPSVALAPPEGVLLDVQASLRCFGGFGGLTGRLRAALAPLGHTVWLASAPTAQGAALLARLGDALHCDDLDTLRCTLDAAPVRLLGWRHGSGLGRARLDALQRIGVRTLGDLRRLPRAGLTRRFGEALLAELDCALGQRPDPRRWLLPPEAFHSRLELAALAETGEQVLRAAAILLARLVAWAGARQAQVRRFTLQMLHEPRRRGASAPASELEIALAEPSLDAGHLRWLLRERLAQWQLAAPTLELRLRCDDVVRRGPPNRELFPTGQSEREGLVRLIERLQARLGRDRVQRLVLREDHRPERATAACAADPAALGASDRVAAGRPPAPQTRPIWLLPQMQPLAERRSHPLLDGAPLQLLSGPERIESGWWDGALAERDYFIAQTGSGALVWIYRARLPLAAGEGGGWFLHGRFG